MIALNQKYNLGRKAFFLLFSRKSNIAWVSLVIVVILLLLQRLMSENVAKVINSASHSAVVTNAQVFSAFSYVAVFFFLIGIVIFIVAFIVSYLEHRSYSFTLEEFSLVVRSGILNKKEISVPYRQIQNVEIERSLAYQFFGLSKLLIDTSAQDEADGTSPDDIVLESIDKVLAEEVRDMLEREIGIQIVRTEGDVGASSPTSTSPGDASVFRGE